MYYIFSLFIVVAMTTTTTDCSSTKPSRKENTLNIDLTYHIQYDVIMHSYHLLLVLSRLFLFLLIAQVVST